MRLRRSLLRNESGAAIVETAFALPILVVMIWMFVQLAQVYRAMAGIQQALGQGARYATLCLNPSTSTGCAVPAPGTGTSPAAGTVKRTIYDAVYGIGPGQFVVDDPTTGTSGTGKYYDLKVTYTQRTNLLLFPGPNISVSRSKRVWLAGG